MWLINKQCLSCDYLGTSECDTCLIRDIMFEIGQYQTVDVVPVIHAKWEFWIENDNGRVYYCSNCKTVSCDQSPFCPHCGARMYGDV